MVAGGREMASCFDVGDYPVEVLGGGLRISFCYVLMCILTYLHYHYRGIFLWDQLSSDIHYSDDINIFKRNIRFLLNEGQIEYMK